MATINLGAIKFNWKGAYNSSTSYAVDDVVSSGGNSYVCIQAHSNQAVGNATAYWNIMSSAGTNGTDGTDLTTTLTTQGDILYRDGSGLQRLGAGTSGQLLQSGGTGANVSWTDAPSGVIKKIHSFEKASRVTHNQTANTDAFTWTTGFVPLDPVNNKMIITGIVPVDGAGQNFCGYGLRFIKSGGSNYDFDGYGVQYATFNNFMGIQSYTFHLDANVLPAGTYSIRHRQYGNDNGSGVDSYFPNSTEDNRLSSQTRGYLIIQEYKN